MNPRGARAAVIADAKRAYEGFHWGVPAKKVTREDVSPVPKTLIKLGSLQEVVYATTKKGDGYSFYRHKFEGKKPVLAMDFDNDRLHVLGGSYTVTERGIEG